MVVGEEGSHVLSMGRTSGDVFTMNLTPFFAASNSAVTQGAPSKTDANGNPVLPFMVIKGSATDNADADTIARWLGMRALKMEVVFTPLGLWQLPKKGGGKVTGVKARIEAIQVVVGRTGEPVASWSAH
jgi:hypothetical protein